MFEWIKKLLIKPLWKYPGLKLLLSMIFFIIGWSILFLSIDLIESLSTTILVGAGFIVLFFIFLAAALLTYSSSGYVTLKAEIMLREELMEPRFKAALMGLIEETKRTGKADKLDKWMENFYELKGINGYIPYYEKELEEKGREIREKIEQTKTKIATLKEEMGVQ